ncbi:MAG: hypothetical protein GX139_03105 [Armatimonadetes bacterium]|jgi:hypothetical protein|nr:hypothetical protein [Armatimonadota bacterium]
MDDQQTQQPSASLNRALKLGFKGAYDSLGYVAGASFMVFLATAAVFGIMRLVLPLLPSAFGVLLIIPVLFVAWIGTVGVFYYVKKSVFHEHPAPHDTLEGIKRLAVPAVLMFVADLLISTLLIGDVAFFVLAFRSKGGIALAALSMLSAYIGLMWMLMCLYHLPVMMMQLEMESAPTPKKIIYKSFLLAADNPAFTVGLFVVIIAFATLCALPAMLGMALLFPGTAAFVLTYSLRELYIKYDVVEPESEVVEDKPWTLGD